MSKSKNKGAVVNILVKQWYDFMPELRKSIIQYFIELLKENNNELNWQEVLPDLFETVTISYDGGNHPEYASNVFSTLYGMKLDCNKVYFDIEDDSNYSIEGISTEELVTVYQFIQDHKEELGIK